MTTPKPISRLERHVFVCTNDRPPGHPRGCCQSKGSEKLVELFKQGIAGAGLRARVRAQRAGCLDTCEYGPSVVVYPEGIWYGPVRPEDVPEIIESHLKQGQPVERLRIPGKGD